MYDPKGNSRTRDIDAVGFDEVAPPQELSAIVHRFLQVKTLAPLEQDYRFHALPDACTYLIFDQLNPEVTGVTKLQASSEELNLGRVFHFANIRFLPGVWQRDRVPLAHGQVGEPYQGDLPLFDVNQRLICATDAEKTTIQIEFVSQLMAQGIVVPNPTMQAIFAHMEDIYSVADMADVAQISPRQLQRNLKKTTGFTPHDFLKVLRLQQSLMGEPSLSYADQSHFIHSFKKATGYTPTKFAKKFDV